jgi:hypothetical protein
MRDHWARGKTLNPGIRRGKERNGSTEDTATAEVNVDRGYVAAERSHIGTAAAVGRC